MTERLLEHAELVRSVSRKLAADRNDADDVAQDSWLDAISAPPRRDGALGAWLAKVARHRALRLSRTRRRRAEIEELSFEVRPPASPLDELAEQGLHERVRESVAHLDAKYAQAIRLRYFEGLGHFEIAERLGLPVETVRTRLKRALNHLRREFETEGRLDRSRWCLLLVEWVRGERLAELGTGASAIEASPSGTGAGSSAASGSIANEATRLGAGGAWATSLGAAAWWALAAAGVAVLASTWLTGRSDAERPLDARDRLEVAASDARTLAPRSPFERVPRTPLARERDSVAAPRDEASLASEANPNDTRPPAALPGGLRVHATRNGEPVEGLRLRLALADAEFAPIHELLTDARGTADALELAPGVHRLTAASGAEHWVEVRAGERSTLELEVAGGARVAGRTTRLDGSPLPGTEIWIWPTDTSEEAFLAGHSDALGRYELDEVPPGARLGARADGFVAGRLLRVRDFAPVSRAAAIPSTSEIARIDLHVGNAGVSARGRVLDSSGHPIAHARIRALSSGARASHAFCPDGKATVVAPAPTCASDAEGHFELRGLPVGKSRVLSITAPGYAPAECTVAASESSDPVLVRLTPGARAVGRLVDASGAPLAGVRLAAEACAGGALRRTTSDALGHFELDGLAPGSIVLRAALAHDAAAHEARADRALRARTVVREVWIDEGETLEVELALREGPAIFGHADADLAALGPCRAQLVRERRVEPGPVQFLDHGGSWRTLRAGDDFVFAVEPDEGYELRLWSLEADARPLARFADLRATAKPIAISADRLARQSARVTGTLLANDDEPRHFELWSGELRAPLAVEPDAASREFALDRLVSGRYQLFAFSSGHAPTLVRQFTLEAGSTLHLGELEPPRPGALRITLSGDLASRRSWPGVSLVLCGEWSRQTSISIRRDSSTIHWLSDREFELRGLAPGQYVVSLASHAGSDLAWVQRSAEIRPGEAARVELEMRAGHPVDIALMLPASGAQRINRMTFHSEDGEVVVRRFPTGGADDGVLPLSVPIVLAPGAWTVELETGCATADLRFHAPRRAPVLVHRDEWNELGCETVCQSTASETLMTLFDRARRPGER